MSIKIIGIISCENNTEKRFLIISNNKSLRIYDKKKSNYTCNHEFKSLNHIEGLMKESNNPCPLCSNIINIGEKLLEKEFRSRRTILTKDILKKIKKLQHLASIDNIENHFSWYHHWQKGYINVDHINLLNEKGIEIEQDDKDQINLMFSLKYQENFNSEIKNRFGGNSFKI